MITKLAFKLKDCKESHNASRYLKLIPDRNKDNLYFFHIIYSTIRNNLKIWIFVYYSPNFMRLFIFGRMRWAWQV
jgi:hypothetical protein